jgi:hypothetical protein
MFRKLFLLIPILMVFSIMVTTADDALRQNAHENDTAPVMVCVIPSTQEQIDALRILEPYHVSEIPPTLMNRKYYYELPGEQLDYLRTSSISYDVLPHAVQDWEDQYYYSYEEVYDYFVLVTLLYPDIAVMESLGVSTRDSVTIWGLKISDNPDQQEDEPDVLIDAVTHAREPVNTNVCMILIDGLIMGYGIDPMITYLVNETEIWIIPIKNPEGYLYVQTGVPLPWWRKNKRDNNANGIFEGTVYDSCGNAYPSYPDGIDLNRNYPQGWEYAGRPEPCSNIYRGPSSFSENESRMERDLVEREQFVASICFHSFSEYVGYPGEDPAGLDLCEQMAAAINTEDGQGTYDCYPFYGTAHGQSYNWMYWEHGVQAYLIETGTEFFPNNFARISNIVTNNINGIFTLMNRVHGSSIRGNVVDAETGDPLLASVAIEGEVVLNRSRMSEPAHGRFTRLVLPGTYTIHVTMEGYEEYTLSDIVVEEGIPTIVEIPLVSSTTDIEDVNPTNSPPDVRAFSISQNYPNPFNPQTTLQFAVPDDLVPVKVKISIYDLRGRLLRQLLDEEKKAGVYRVHWDGMSGRGEPVPSGVYLYRVEAGEFKSTRKMVLAR